MNIGRNSIYCKVYLCEMYKIYSLSCAEWCIKHADMHKVPVRRNQN